MDYVPGGKVNDTSIYLFLAILSIVAVVALIGALIHEIETKTTKEKEKK
jgi:hypothetical protein